MYMIVMFEHECYVNNVNMHKSFTASKFQIYG